MLRDNLDVILKTCTRMLTVPVTSIDSIEHRAIEH